MSGLRIVIAEIDHYGTTLEDRDWWTHIMVKNRWHSIVWADC